MTHRSTTVKTTADEEHVIQLKALQLTSERTLTCYCLLNAIHKVKNKLSTSIFEQQLNHFKFKLKILANNRRG